MSLILRVNVSAEEKNERDWPERAHTLDEKENRITVLKWTWSDRMESNWNILSERQRNRTIRESDEMNVMFHTICADNFSLHCIRNSKW